MFRKTLLVVPETLSTHGRKQTSTLRGGDWLRFANRSRASLVRAPSPTHLLRLGLGSAICGAGFFTFKLSTSRTSSKRSKKLKTHVAKTGRPQIEAATSADKESHLPPRRPDPDIKAPAYDMESPPPLPP